MNNLKKVTAILLSLIMVLALPVASLAANGTDHEYEIYQIFTGDYYQGILSNVKWGQNGVQTAGSRVSSEILSEIEATKDATDAAKLETINKYADLTSTPLNITPVISDGTITYSGLTNGYYLVKDKNDTQNKENGYYTLYVVQVVDNSLSFEPKGNVPTVEKKISDNDALKDANEASIGDKINYVITGTMPSRIDDYGTYFYQFTDILSKGLTYNNDAKITIDGTDFTKYFYKSAVTEEETTKLVISIADIKALSLLGTFKLTSNSKITITYSATLNENAVIASTGNKNTIDLTYSNDPNHSGKGTTTPPSENPNEPKTDNPTGITPKDTVVTYTTELTILKTTKQKTILPGAEFTLSGNGVDVVLVYNEFFRQSKNGGYYKLSDGTYTETAPTPDTQSLYDNASVTYEKVREYTVKGKNQAETNVVGTIDETGYVTFTGLGAGDYKITETKTPNGYNTIDPISFTIEFDEKTLKFATDKDSKDVITIESDNTLYTQIINERGAILPSTGGIGTTLFYIFGTILVLAAAIILITKKRMSVKEK